MIYIIGDSHSWTFENIGGCKIHHLGPVTMHRIGRDGIDMKHVGVDENDFVVLTFGEIDVRCHIGIQRDKHKRNLDEIIETLAENFVVAICKNKKQFSNIHLIVCSVIPPTDISYNPDFPYYGTLEDRISLTKKLNGVLETKCATNNLSFVNTYDYYSAERGELNPSLSDGSVHIHSDYSQEIKRCLFDCIDTLKSVRSYSENEDNLIKINGDLRTEKPADTVKNHVRNNTERNVPMGNFTLPPYGRKVTFNFVRDIVMAAMNNPLILELGMTSAAGLWDGYGYSTPFFSYLVNLVKGELFSVDVDPATKDTCESILREYGLYTDRVHLIVEDGVSFLTRWGKDIGKPVDVLYLDAWDYGEGDIGKISEENHLKAFKAIEKSLSRRALVLIDDVHDLESLKGKGRLVIPYLLETGYVPLYLGYQCIFAKRGSDILSNVNNIRHTAFGEIQDINKSMQSAIKYVQTGNLKEAENLLEKILRVQPNNVNALHFFGLVCYQRKEYFSAAMYIKESIQLAPNYADACNNLGSVYQELGQLNEAVTWYQKTLEINPAFIEASINLMNIYKEKGEFQEAIAFCRKIFEIDRCYPGIYQNLLFLLFMTGNLNEALNDTWQLLKVVYSPRHQKISQPLWDGSDIRGKTLFLHGGCFGDNIMYIRYVPTIARHGAKVIYECRKELLSLLRSVEGIHQFIVSDNPWPEFDFHCPVLCLPMALNTDVENIPAEIPYVKTDPLLVEKWRDKVKHDNSKLKVGLVWSAGNVDSREIRMCPLELFSPLSQLDDISFYSLQKGEAAKQVKHPPTGIKLIDYTEELQDFSDTAALIENLNLVISVDTAVAHLAGALGKPVWTLLNYHADWKWLENREDSPWYPTMRLFRQPSPGDWESVIARLLDELKKLL
ncbi:MAG: tetratricopeptide repeat protein [Thermodesulfovibrionales bacterium]